MTVEDKAVEIAHNAKKQTYFDERCNDLAGNLAYQSAWIMAVFKDQQFKKYLEKLEDDCDKEYKAATTNNDIYEAGKAYGRKCLIIQIIDELFGEE